ncbi:hypothetical protein DL96DRAFT_1445420, partial [Flagelloscypha sp. PMI_526]
MALPSGIQTLEHLVTGKGSRLDNVWVTEHMMDMILTCNLQPNKQSIKTDHYLYMLKLDLDVIHTVPGTKRAFRNVVWEDFRKELRKHLEKFPPPRPITNADNLQKADNELTKVIQQTIEEVVPIAKLGAKTHRWWNEDLTKMCTKYNQIKCKSYRFRAIRDHKSHGIQKAYQNEY